MKNKTLKIKDRIYGEYEINSPVILELLNSPSLQRLKDISQMGPPDPYYHIPNYSRYEHSIGVMLMLNHLHASELEQVAGLLHDVSHTAFSHLIDWVVGSGAVENFQDNQHESFIRKSEIPDILKKHNYTVDSVVNHKHFSLLEQDIPSLCADRADYSLREFPIGIARGCFSHLEVFQNHIAFDNERDASIFAHEFLLRQSTHWGGYEAVTRYNLFSSVLKRALALRIISMQSFQEVERPIVGILENSKDMEIRTILKILKNSDLSHLKKDREVTHKKFRYVDPEIHIKDHIVTLSSINNDFKKEVEYARKENEMGIRSGTI